MSDARLRFVTGAALFLPLAAIFAFAGLLAPPAVQAEAAPKLLLLPILVHSAEDPTYLREGLEDMLTARLQRIGAGTDEVMNEVIAKRLGIRG